MSPTFIKLLLLLSFAVNVFKPYAYCQMQNNTNESAIWGSSPLNAEIINAKNLIDKNWSKLPSEQDKKDMWGRTINEPLLKTKKTKDIDGKKYVVNQNNVVVYDEELQLLLDSSIAANSNITNLDVATVAPPPDDPQDVPIDNGKLILLVAAFLIKYYKNNEPQ